jgi:transketolase
MAVSDQSVATGTQLDQLCINTIRTLSMDAVQKANSGHPGTPMALAPVAYCLWQQFLRYDPEDPIWANRDRFVLSNGHASMLLYSLLHLAGVREVSPEGEILSTPACRSTTSRIFANSAARRRGIPNTA